MMTIRIVVISIVLYLTDMEEHTVLSKINRNGYIKLKPQK